MRRPVSESPVGLRSPECLPLEDKQAALSPGLCGQRGLGPGGTQLPVGWGHESQCVSVTSRCMASSPAGPAQGPLISAGGRKEGRRGRERESPLRCCPYNIIGYYPHVAFRSTCLHSLITLRSVGNQCVPLAVISHDI